MIRLTSVVKMLLRRCRCLLAPDPVIAGAVLILLALWLLGLPAPGYAQAPVSVGRSSEMYIEIVDGLAEGDTVLLRQPAPERVTSRIDVESAERERQVTGDRPKARPAAGKPRPGRPTSGGSSTS